LALRMPRLLRRHLVSVRVPTPCGSESAKVLRRGPEQSGERSSHVAGSGCAVLPSVA